jgi:hypothetical protein
MTASWRTWAIGDKCGLLLVRFRLAGRIEGRVKDKLSCSTSHKSKSERRSKNNSSGISVVREPKLDLCLEIGGKCDRASGEPERAPLGAEITPQCMFRLTLPWTPTAPAKVRNARPRLGLKRSCSHRSLKWNQ